MSLIYNYLVEMGFDIAGGKCRCGSPIVMRGDWVGCWECLTSGELARRGRNLLERVKVKLDMRTGERPFWPEGMAL